MQRLALIQSGIVVNVVEAHEGWRPGDDIETAVIKADSPVGPGWTYDGADFMPEVVIDKPPPITNESTIESIVKWIDDFKASVATASDLADLKTKLPESPKVAAATAEIAAE